MLLWILPLLFLFVSGCTGSADSTYEITPEKAPAVEAIAIDSLSSYVNNWDVRNFLYFDLSSGLVDSWTSTQTDALTSSGVSRPLLSYSSDRPWVVMANANDLTGTPRLPEHLSQNFTFFLVAKINDGFNFRFGTSSTNEAFTLDYNSPSWRLRHSSTTGNYRDRNYDVTLSDAPHVITLSMGAASKDLELYIDGFRQSYDSTLGSGSAVDFQTVARDLVISNTTANLSQIGQLLIYNEKLTPQKIYALSSTLGTSWGISISEAVTKEIKKDIVPDIEPELVDETYIFSAILTSKCITCHRAGGSSTIHFETPSELNSATNLSGTPLIIAGDSLASPLYQSVANNSMPFGGPVLSTTEKNLIKDWIDNGAP
jgi:hypothetical protein